MRGFNPEVKASVHGEAEVRTQEQNEIGGTLEERLRQLSAEERAWLKEDALRTYNESELIIHTLNRIDTPELQETLF